MADQIEKVLLEEPFAYGGKTKWEGSMYAYWYSFDGEGNKVYLLVETNRAPLDATFTLTPEAWEIEEQKKGPPQEEVVADAEIPL